MERNEIIFYGCYMHPKYVFIIFDIHYIVIPSYNFIIRLKSVSKTKIKVTALCDDIMVKLCTWKSFD